MLAQVVAEARDWVVRAQALDLVGWPVGAVVIVARVRRQAHAMRLDQRRALAAARARHGPASSSVARQYVGTIDFDTGDAIGHAAIGDALDRHLLAHWHRDCIIVILALKNDRKFVYRSQVDRLVEIALAGGAFAERDPRDRI